MLDVDLHVHSFFSLCGIHTHLELLNQAKALGMKGIAIADHGPMLKGRINTPFFERFENPVAGVRLIRGMECNLTDVRGKTDMPDGYLRYMDIVLLWIHCNTPKDLDGDEYTDFLVAAIENNPYVDIIAHLNDPAYPSHFSAVVECAKKHGCAIELNNSKTQLARAKHERTLELVETCRAAGCRLVVTSDTHGINELGCDSAVLPYLKQTAFPGSLVVSRDEESAIAFVEERAGGKPA